MYLEKHILMWYRLCLNASGMLSAIVSDRLRTGAEAIWAGKQMITEKGVSNAERLWRMKLLCVLIGVIYNVLIYSKNEVMEIARLWLGEKEKDHSLLERNLKEKKGMCEW